MKTISFSGEELERALQEGTLTENQFHLNGMVKPSEKAGYIKFSLSGCHEWVDMPAAMIKQADHIGQFPCKDHFHPLMRITLEEPKEQEGKVLLTLLISHRSSLPPTRPSSAMSESRTRKQGFYPIRVKPT